MQRSDLISKLAIFGCVVIGLASNMLPATTSRADDSPNAKAAELKQLNLTDYRGKTWDLNEFADKPVLVVAFLGVECPLAKMYAKRLDELASSLASQGVAIIGIDANPQDSLAEMAAFARRQELEFPLLRDGQQELVAALGATRTPEVFVLDAKRSVRYHGRIDDQYGVGYARQAPTRQLLHEAIDCVLAGQPVLVAHEPAVGCLIGKTKRAAEVTSLASNNEPLITYSEHIAPIFRDACVSCHRPNQIGPFPMTDYAEIAGWAEMIAEVVGERRMPPWHASPEYGKFANDCSLSEAQRELVLKWVAAGAPEGDASKLPEPRKYVEGWQLERAPDLVLDVTPKPLDIPATGELKYIYKVVDPEFKEDKWVRAAQIVPGNPSVVHHILVFVHKKGTPYKLQGERGFLFGYVPGSIAQSAPTGAAKRIPADHDLIVQIHYTPIGTPQTDQSKIGLLFVDESEVKNEIITTSSLETQLNIPPNEPNYTATGAMPEALNDCQILSLAPHMHLRGKSFRYELTSPDHSKKILLDVPKYDFNWQTAYRLAEPLKVSAGSTIVCRATFDNSAANLNNPDPNATVKWGDQTDDEMMIGYFDVLVPKGSAAFLNGEEGERLRMDAQRRKLIQIIKQNNLLKKWDTNGDGQFQVNEVPENQQNHFRLLDKDHNQVITKDELEESLE